MGPSHPPLPRSFALPEHLGWFRHRDYLPAPLGLRCHHSTPFVRDNVVPDAKYQLFARSIDREGSIVGGPLPGLLLGLLPSP